MELFHVSRASIRLSILYSSSFDHHDDIGSFYSRTWPRKYGVGQMALRVRPRWYTVFLFVRLHDGAYSRGVFFSSPQSQSAVGKTRDSANT